MSDTNRPKVQIDQSWYDVIGDEFEKPYFKELSIYLHRQKEAGKTIYPPGPLIFNAFNKTPFQDTRVVIIGQDPYHGPGQAMGLCFSVPQGIAIPASLKNIYKEMQEDVGIEIPTHGDLSAWTNQGVFLLNAILTVEHKQAGSHKNIGWQQFTDKVIETISDRLDGIVFLLWGNFAKSKTGLIDEFKHYVLDAAHPSPLAGGAFFGNKHFSKTNELLLKQGKEAINWQI